jgi:16S rRNA (guanine527-N7)-methyltransferase
MPSNPRRPSKHTPKTAFQGHTPRGDAPKKAPKPLQKSSKVPFKPAAPAKKPAAGGDAAWGAPARERPAGASGWESGKGARKNPRPDLSGPRPGAPVSRGTFAAREKAAESGNERGSRAAAWGAAAKKKGPRLPPFARSQQVSRAVYGHTVPPSRSRLEELLVSYGVTMPAGALDKVWQYHQILRKNNGDLDLTRLIGFETIVQRHYADCLILHKLMKGKWPSPMVDIGTGAGFPGLMIKIASPSTKLILSEPRNVRVDFLNNTIQELGLKDIEVFGHKFTSKSFSQPLQGAISRAFEPIGKTLPRLEKSLAVGGLAIFMKGPGVDEELSAKLPSNYKLVMDERYRIPKTTLDRALVIFERTA